MGRIRSIKPSFWTDGDNLSMSDSCALFFIGLWNFCDDEGKHRFDLNQLVAELGGRWHRGKVKLFISCLVKSGQLILNSDSTWIQVTGWSHQKIDKPKQPDIKSSEIQWLTPEQSWKVLDDSRGIGARIGEDRKDRIGEDRGSGSGRLSKRRGKVTALRPPKATAPEGVNLAIGLYVDLWKKKYADDPPLGGKNIGLLKTLVRDHGLEKAMQYLEAYLQMPDSWFVTKRHDLPTLLANLNNVTHYIATGKLVTRKEIRQLEDRVQTQNLLDMVESGQI